MNIFCLEKVAPTQESGEGGLETPINLEPGTLAQMNALFSIT